MNRSGTEIFDVREVELVFIPVFLREVPDVPYLALRTLLTNDGAHPRMFLMLGLRISPYEVFESAKLQGAAKCG